MLQVVITVFNVFPMSKLFDLLEDNVTYLNVYLSGFQGASHREEITNRHYYSSVQLFDIAIWNFLQFFVTLRMSMSNC